MLSEVLGRDDVKLYDGSMVEWTADGSNPLVAGESNMDKVKNFLKACSAKSGSPQSTCRGPRGPGTIASGILPFGRILFDRDHAIGFLTS